MIYFRLMVLSWCLISPSTATDKVALLIGNMNYVYHTQLCAPIADVHELTNLLRQMDFKVVSLLDLNWQEMHSAVTEFLLLLDKGVYGWVLVHLGNMFKICFISVSVLLKTVTQAIHRPTLTWQYIKMDVPLFFHTKLFFNKIKFCMKQTKCLFKTHILLTAII